MTEEIKTEIPTEIPTARSCYKDVVKNVTLIDGVDVAGYYHFGVFGGGMCGLSECGGLCKDFNNCLYKQLKRLEQENKANEKQIELDVEHICRLNEQIEKLEQENKELKIKLSSTKCYLCGEGFLTPEGTELYEEKERYRSALEEIRDYLNTLSSVDSDFINTETYLRIQDKTKEVLNG